MDLALVRVTAEGDKRAVKIARDRTVIGRQEDAHIRIGIADVSRQHCELTVAGDTVMIRDLNSSNGTLVNGAAVTETSLSAGDLLAVGPVAFVVRIDGVPGSFDAAAKYKEAFGGPGPETATHLDDTGMRPGEGRLVDASDESSIVEFDFDDDDEDEQPPL